MKNIFGSRGNRGLVSLPAAIIVGAIVIAAAIIYATLPASPASSGGAAEKTVDINSLSPGPDQMKPVTASDHILGKNSASIKIVEFSDTECPFCKSFHKTMHTLLEEYGLMGEVAWVYRHFPLESIHPKAPKEAEATECAAELGGHVKFWEFADKIFEITPSNNGLDLALLPKIAEDIGLDKKAFEACMETSSNEKVQKDFELGGSIGVSGTPLTVLIPKNGAAPTPINGAQSFETVKAMIDAALAN